VTNEWLFRALEESRARGFLGPGPIEPHLEHAQGYRDAWSTLSTEPPTHWMDLGSGGGLPGLYLLSEWNTPGTLLDAMIKRTSFLSEVLRWSGAPVNGSVRNGRAEELARDPELCDVFDLVVVRSFGPPATTAECAVRFTRDGGYIIISEPPDSDGGRRWDPAGLALLGLEAVAVVEKGPTYQILRKITPTPDAYPRRIGTPAKRPLF